MGRWLLENLPFPLLGLLFVGGPALLATTVALVLRRRLPDVARGRFADTGTTLLTETLAVYGLVLAFVIVNQYGDANEADTDVQTEALNVEDLYRMSQSFPDPARSQMTGAIAGYVTAVVEDEFPDLAAGEDGSAAAAAGFERLYTVLSSHEPTTTGEAYFYEQGLVFLHDAHAARHRRLDAAADALPTVLVAFLVLGAVASVGSTYLLGLHDNQLLISAGLAALLGFTLLLSLTLEHPFSGPDAISSSHFTTGALAEIYEPSG